MATSQKTGRRGLSPRTAGITLSREFQVFAPTADDGPMDSPVEKDKMDHFKKWYDRCAINLADGQYIKDMWSEWNKKRKMVDPKNLPTPLAQARSNLPQPTTQDAPTSNGSPIDVKSEGKATAQGSSTPPHSFGEGTQSSPSDSAAKPATPLATAAMPKGKPGKAKAKATAPTKRRRVQSAGPTIGLRKMLAEPAPVVVEQGWSIENTALFEEWKLH